MFLLFEYTCRFVFEMCNFKSLSFDPVSHGSQNAHCNLYVNVFDLLLISFLACFVFHPKSCANFPCKRTVQLSIKFSFV